MTTQHDLTLPAEYRLSLQGQLIVSPRYGKTTFAKLGDDTISDLFDEFTTLLAEDGVEGANVVLQYTGGPDGKEAGSAWFVQTDPETGASEILGYLHNLNVKFQEGATFVV